MNKLIVGSNKEPLLQNLPDKFLIIDDGELIDQLEFPARKAITVFDPAVHSFNPLNGMNYLKARQFWDVLKAAFPEGEDTLTKAAAEFQILEALTQKPRKLDRLVKDTKETRYAYQMIEKLLLSPVLERVLNNPTNFSFKGTILARLDRAELGDFDCFVLANLLISQSQRAVVVPDFGFYQCPFHIQLVRQGRLIAGINSFDEVPRLRSQLVQIADKRASRATPEDAKLLAIYEGIMPGTNRYNDFIAQSIA